jgi:hypothetical protein
VRFKGLRNFSFDVWSSPWGKGSEGGSFDDNAMTAKSTLRNLESKKGLGTALSGKTSKPELHCLVIRPDSSGGRGGHAGMRAQVGAKRNVTITQFIPEGVASTKKLATNPNGRGRFDNESPDREAGERDVPLRVQAPVAGVGNDDKEIGLASLSLGKDTVYRARTYVIVDPEVEQNGSLKVESLLKPEITKAIMAVLNEHFEEQRVFFTTFTRYLLDKERSFQIMIEDLLRHREASHNNKLPLVLKDDVPRFRLIANRRMLYLRETYRRFKDTVSEAEKDIIALMRVHMKRCIRQCHTLIPQLDLVATQWGISIEAVLSQKDFGSPKLERKGRKSKSNQEDSDHSGQARRQPLVEDDPLAGSSAGSSHRGGTSAAADQSCTVPCPPVARSANFAGSSQQKTKTRGLLTKAIGNELQKKPGISNMSSQDADMSPSPSSTLVKTIPIASDVEVQLLQVCV